MRQTVIDLFKQKKLPNLLATLHNSIINISKQIISCINDFLNFGGLIRLCSSRWPNVLFSFFKKIIKKQNKTLKSGPIRLDSGY